MILRRKWIFGFMSDDSRLVLETILEQERERSAPTLAADEFFEIFSAEQILKSRSFDLDADQIRSGITGGGLDGGVDAIYLFVNQKLVREDTDLAQFHGQKLSIELIIIQAKHSASFSANSVLKFGDFSQNLLRLSADVKKTSNTLYNSILKGIVSRFHTVYRDALSRRPQLRVTFYLTSLGEQVHPTVIARSEALIQQVKDYYSIAECSSECAGAKKLTEWFYQAPTKTLTMEVSRSIPWSGFGNSYVCIVSLRQFWHFISYNGILRTHIFEANVRDYQGDVAVNREIGDTLLNQETEEFWWLNNGITILASNITSSGDVFSITDPLIVNGLQTSHRIHSHFKEHDTKGEMRTVLVRIIKSTDSGSVDRIIKATNSQTSIPRVWLHATEDIHRKIETILSSVGLYYDRRKNYYRNQGVPPSKIVTIPYLAQALAAIVLQKPDDARARPTTVAEKHYADMFSDECPVEVYSRCALLLKRVDEFMDGFQGRERSDKLNITFYLAMCVACGALESACPKRYAIATLDLSKCTDRLIQYWFDHVAEKYLALGGDDRVAKGPRLSEELKGGMEEAIENYGEGASS